MKHLYAVQHYPEIIDSANRLRGTLATPDHATLVMHLYAVEHYIQIFDSVARRPGNPATRRHGDSPNIQPYLAFIGYSGIRRPGNLGTPDNVTLAKHLFAVQHYTEIFDSATQRPTNPWTWVLAKQTTLLSLYMRLGDPATRQPGDPRSCNLS